MLAHLWLALGVGCSLECLPVASPCAVGFSQHDSWVLSRNIPRLSVRRDPCVNGEVSCDFALEVTQCHLCIFWIIRPVQIQGGDCTRVGMPRGMVYWEGERPPGDQHPLCEVTGPVSEYF